MLNLLISVDFPKLLLRVNKQSVSIRYDLFMEGRLSALKKTYYENTILNAYHI